jgi:hypothetical protein
MLITVSSADGHFYANALMLRANQGAENLPPALSISEPDGIGDTVDAGDPYNITYTLSDPDNIVTAVFFYDVDNTGLNGTAITGACSGAAEGTGVTCMWDTTGMPSGSYYVYGITNDGSGQVSAYSPGMITITGVPMIFSDDFSTNTTGEYTVTHTWTQGGTGSFLYDSVGKRARVLTGDNVGLKFSHNVPSLDNGTFSIDFLPTTKYPYGGEIYILLVQDQNNYYKIFNTDGYGAKSISKIVNGQVVDSASFTNQYSQNNNYHITITFSSTQTTVNAFGNILTMNTNNSNIVVNSFEVELRQQHAYFDNIGYTGSASDTPPVSTISAPANGSTLNNGAANPYTISGTATDNIAVQGIKISTDNGNTWSAATCSGCPGVSVTWTYSWALPADGSYTVKSRATDNAGNVETPKAGNTVTIDRTGPMVSSTNPTNGATGVALNTDVTINWNENVDCATITTSTVTINPAVGWTRFNCSGNQAVFKAAAQEGSTTYTVNISTAVKDIAGNEMTAVQSISYTTATGVPMVFSDDFSINTTGEYTVTHTWTQGGTGSFLYDSVGKRVRVLTGDNVGLKFSHNVPSFNNGTFSIDFLPTTKYPYGGEIYILLVQDQNNYYKIFNTDGYGAKSISKIVNGQVVDSASFTNQYSQNNNYHITITFSSTQTTVDAFGNVLTMNTNNSNIVVGSFEVELRQQHAYFDNIEYSE